MCHRPDGSYNWIGHWICHYMDHWSKVLVLFPLMYKCAEEVALSLSTKVFSYFGPARILQSDNGREFVNAVIHKLVEDWPGEITTVNGRARHPQSQGLVERANAKVEQMLGCRFYEGYSDEFAWTMWLPEIQCEPIATCTTIYTYMWVQATTKQS